jgi:protein involved in polysaccharide export with SLBB domain
MAPVGDSSMRVTIRWTLTSLLLASITAAGCAGLPVAPKRPMDDVAFAAPILAGHSGIADDRPPALVLLPGDRVNLELSSASVTRMTDVLIEASGSVHLALAGDVEIAGLGLTAAEAKLTKALQRYDSLMHVTVTIAQLDGHKVTVAGAVQSPGVVPLQAAARLADVIMSAGGTITNLVNGQMVDGADLGNASLIRDGVTLPIDFQRALGGDPLHNVYMRAGDQIYIPSGRGLTVSIMGQTGGSVVQWAPGFRLSQALAMSGGIGVGGDKDDVRIVRGTLDAPRVYQASVRDLIDGNGHDVELYPGDLVFVTDHWVEDFGEVSTILAPIVSLAFSIGAFSIALDTASNQP